LDLVSFVADRNYSTVVKILGYQVLVTLLVAFGFAIAYGWHQALSPLMGGLVAVIPNFYFALRTYKASGQDAKKIVRSFYVGEAGKLLLTGTLFTMVLQMPDLRILPLFVGYVAALSVFWFALLMH
jgi:ATP synthase protein I